MLLFKGYIAVFLYGICTLAQVGSITIFTQPAFTRQRDCVKLCFVCSTSCPTVWGVVGCGGALEDDACVCRNDLWDMASSFFTSCISTRCGTTVTDDLASALSLYNGYCHVDGATLQNDLQPLTTVATAAKTTTQASGPTPIATSSAVASTLATFASSTPQSTSTSTSAKPEMPGQSNVGAIVGGAVAGVIVIGIAATIITMLILREQRHRRREQHLAPQPAMQTSRDPFSPPVAAAAVKTSTVRYL